MTASFTISRLALAADVHVETVRYYQRRGLLSQPRKAPGSIRRYGEPDVERLRFIKAAQGVGFTLDEVGQLLELRANVSCTVARSLASSKIAFIDERIASLSLLRAELATWIASCDANADDATCPVLEHLETTAHETAACGAYCTSTSALER